MGGSGGRGGGCGDGVLETRLNIPYREEEEAGGCRGWRGGAMGRGGGVMGGREVILELSPNSLLSSCQRSSSMMKLISGKVVRVGAGAETGIIGDGVPGLGIVDIGIGGTVWVTGDALEIGSAGLGFADIVDSCCIMTAWF